MDGGWLRLVGVVTTVNGGGFFCHFCLSLFLSRLQLSHEMDESTSRVMYWKRILSLFLLPLRCSHRSGGGERCYMVWWLGKRWDNLKAIKSALKYHTWHHRLRLYDSCVYMVRDSGKVIDALRCRRVCNLECRRNVILMAFAFTYHLFRRDRSAFVEQQASLFVSPDLITQIRHDTTL